MATRQLDAHLAEVVERSRARAAELGELGLRAREPDEAAFPAEAQTILVEWLRDGGYTEALAAVADEDPDLAVQ